MLKNVLIFILFFLGTLFLSYAGLDFVGILGVLFISAGMMITVGVD